MTKMHKDILGNAIKDGDSVVYPDHNRMKVGSVKKSTPKMVMVQSVGKAYTDRKYPTEVLVVNDPKLSLYMLKHSK